MAAKSKRFDLRTTPEFYDEVKAKAAELGVSVNDYVEQAVKAQVDGVRQDAVQDAIQGTVQDSSAQLDRIEANMEVLYHGMVALVERQEQGMRALASGIQRLADAPAEQPPALPEAKQPMTEADYWREYKTKRKEQGVNVIIVR